VTIGSSIFLIAVGAILRYAVTDEISGIDLEVVGLILMIAGLVGLAIGLYMMTTQDRGTGDGIDRDPPPPRA
jgi:hypothetical protein